MWLGWARNEAWPGEAGQGKARQGGAGQGMRHGTAGNKERLTGRKRSPFKTTKIEDTMSVKLETLLIRNFKRVRLAEVELSEAGVNIIGGANGAGKSTFLDAVKYLLGGAKYAPSNPHNAAADGATATIRTTLSNGIEVERSGAGGTLKVDGKKGNQATLNEFLNEFALDINKFMRSTDKDKAKLLIEHLGIGEKLEHLDKKIEAVYAERTLVSRDAERKRQLADALPTYDNAPEKRVDVSELLTQERMLSFENRTNDERREELARIVGEGLKKRAELERLREQMKAVEAEMLALRTKHDAIKAEVDAYVPHDLTAIEHQLKNSESINMMIEANAKAKAAQEEADAVEKERQRLTDEIEEARAQRLHMLNSIKMPMDGLQIVDGDLQYRGQRWDCMSGSERLKVATAISRAFRPECGFVLVDELEQMDWKTVKEFDAWARAEGVQILGAMVCDEDKAGENVIIIEDGRVKE